MGLFWVPGHSRVRADEIADRVATEVTICQFVGPEPSLGVSRQNIRIKTKCWMDKQRMALLLNYHTQRQARKWISGPRQTGKTRLLSFNRTQSGVVTGLITGRNTFGRHLHIMGLNDSPLPSRYAAEFETSAHVFRECEALALHRRAYLGSFFLDPEDVGSLSLRAVWNFSKVKGLP